MVWVQPVEVLAYVDPTISDKLILKGK